MGTHEAVKRCNTHTHTINQSPACTRSVHTYKRKHRDTDTDKDADTDTDNDTESTPEDSEELRRWGRHDKYFRGTTENMNNTSH